MLERYTREEMGNVWSLHNQYASWLKVEVAAVKAWGKLGKIPAADVARFKRMRSLMKIELLKLKL